jgi:hypothetical protein
MNASVGDVAARAAVGLFLGAIVGGSYLVAREIQDATHRSADKHDRQRADTMRGIAAGAGDAATPADVSRLMWHMEDDGIYGYANGRQAGEGYVQLKGRIADREAAYAGAALLADGPSVPADTLAAAYQGLTNVVGSRLDAGQRMELLGDAVGSDLKRTLAPGDGEKIGTIFNREYDITDGNFGLAYDSTRDEIDHMFGRTYN